jgi:spore germination cell wall hydrolase CwlJ-like protein
LADSAKERRLMDAIDVGDDWEAEPVEHDPFAAAGGNPAPSPQSAGGIGSDAVAGGTAGAVAPPPMDPHDRDLMIRTIAGEASGEPPLGQAAVAHTIFNRAAAGGYGDGIAGVVQAPVKPGSSYHQYSVWNAPGMPDSSAIVRNLKPSDPTYARIGDIVDQAHAGEIPDLTNGATHYYAPRSMPGGKAPPWAAALARQNQVRIGNQIFVGGSTGPGQSLPSQIAGGYADEGVYGG